MRIITYRNMFICQYASKTSYSTYLGFPVFTAKHLHRIVNSIIIVVLMVSQINTKFDVSRLEKASVFLTGMDWITVKEEIILF